MDDIDIVIVANVEARLASQAERIAELEAENERLKCCGNCKHMDEDCFCSAVTPGATMPWHWHTSPPDPCHFTPSRWTKKIAP